MKKMKPNKIKKSFDLDEGIVNSLREMAWKLKVHEVVLVQGALKNHLDCVAYDEVTGLLGTLTSEQLRSVSGMIKDILKVRRRKNQQ